MRDINLLRDDFVNCPEKLELLNFIYETLEENNFPDSIKISLPKHYSSKLKKLIPILIGYKVKGKKISDCFVIKKMSL